MKVLSIRFGHRRPLFASLGAAMLVTWIGSGGAFAQSTELAEVGMDDETVPRSIPSTDGLAADTSSDEAEAPAGGDEVQTDSKTEKDWRVTPGDEPPIQVRRAVEQVEQSASTLAASIDEARDARDQKPNDSDDGVEKRPHLAGTGSDDPSRFASLKEAVDLEKIRGLSKKLLTADGRPQFDLSPHVDDERWFEAIELLEDDECDDAHQLAKEALDDLDPGRESQVAIQYAMGRIQMCTDGHRSEGRRALEEIADDGDGPIAEMARRRLGRSDDPEATTPEEALGYRDRIAAAVTRAKQGGEVDQALLELEALHDKLTKDTSRYHVRSAQVDILEHDGRLEEAARTMLGIYRQTRTWRVGDRVERRLRRLERRAGLKLLTLGERIDRMRELIQRGKYTRARKLSVETAKDEGVGGDEIDGWSLFRRGLQAERKRKRKEAADLFERAERLVDSDAIRPRLYYGWARALRRLDRDEEAIELYVRLCEEYPAQRLCDEALFEAGRLSQYLNRHDRAREFFAQVVGLFPDSDKVPESLWRGAFSAYLMGDHEAAQRPLLHLRAHYGDVQDASELTMGLKAQYWLGVTKLEAGEVDEAIDALHKTVARGPLTWYGRLAAMRLEEAGEEPRVRLPSSSISSSELEDLSTLRVPRDSRLEVAAEYARLGLYSDAIDELREQTASFPAPERAHQMLAAVYLADGQPNWAHWIMKRHIDESGPTYQNLRDWGVAFPTNYLDLSHQYGERFEVSPFLVQAIIRQESGFRAGVQSYAGALGLMQLMPGTARYTEDKFFDETGRVTHATIVEPENNVRLGTMYVRLHTAYASDQIPLALAGYNAGPAPLESWLERYGDRDLDAWVESITYREARGYVRKVFTSYVTYAALYGDGSLPEVSLEMPDELRDWGEVPEVESVDEGEPISRR